MGWVWVFGGARLLMRIQGDRLKGLWGTVIAVLAGFLAPFAGPLVATQGEPASLLFALPAGVGFALVLVHEDSPDKRPFSRDRDVVRTSC